MAGDFDVDPSGRPVRPQFIPPIQVFQRRGLFDFLSQVWSGCFTLLILLMLLPFLITAAVLLALYFGGRIREWSFDAFAESLNVAPNVLRIPFYTFCFCILMCLLIRVSRKF